MDIKNMKKKLTKEEHKVLIEQGTEMPFSGEYLNKKLEGIYNCKLCGNQLFLSNTKFDSGTGWPSFDEAIEGSIKYNEDNSQGMSRNEVSCAKCGGHLGHMFPDGPKETTGKRFCINSVSLDFDEKDIKKKEN